ncbi:MAG TPA: hypothetical protein VFG62_01475 [Rhodopila sp.]|nr:hypothetical protein [Rhodopila sp.]
MAVARTSSSPTEPSPPPYPRDALFRPDGPINPLFVDEMVRSLMRTLPHDPDEDEPARNRRMYATMSAISGMYPRDEIEMMYCVGAVAAFHAAMAGWRIGMNGAAPNGESTRHIAGANASIRTFDSMAKGLERRQARPCVAPPGPNAWNDIDLKRYADWWTERVRACSLPLPDAEEPPPTAPLPVANEAPPVTPDAPEPQARQPAAPGPIWTTEMVAKAEAEMGEADAPPPPVEGVEPDGSIVVPDNPTPEQEAYMGARIIHNARDQWTETIASGQKPKIPRLRPGDRIP